MSQVLVVCPEKDAKSGAHAAYNQRCRDYAEGIRHRVPRGVQILELPRDKPRILRRRRAWKHVVLLTHGKDRKVRRHTPCRIGDSSAYPCSCLSHNGRIGALSAAEARSSNAFRGSRVFAATTCYAANHFARNLMQALDVQGFVGHTGVYEHVDVRELFGVYDDNADPFGRAITAGVLWLVADESSSHIAETVRGVYNCMLLDVYDDARLPLVERTLVKKCIEHNINVLKYL